MAERRTDLIRDALARLDTGNDEHWTADGLPLVEMVATLAVLPDLRQRSEITDAGPCFTRTHPSFEVRDARAETPPDTEKPADPDPPAPAAVGTSPEDELASAQRELAAAQGVLRKAELRVGRANERLNAIANERLQASQHPQASQHEIQRYLATQQRMRLERAERDRRIREAGISPADIASRLSKIDESMRRKTGYGHQRPVRQPVVERGA